MSEDTLSVLITGFGPFLNVKTNPSFEITRQLPNSITHNGKLITLYAHPSPLPVDYHGCVKLIPELLRERKYDLVLHIGLDVENTFFHIEKGADREGYHQVPDEKRRVVTKAQNKSMFGKAPARLDSGFDLEEALGVWKRVAGVSEKVWKDNRMRGVDGVRKNLEDLRVTDGVGSYICGFVYYNALRWYWERTDRHRVIFLHMPMLEGQAQVSQGVDVVLRLVKALCEQVD